MITGALGLLVPVKMHGTGGADGNQWGAGSTCHMKALLLKLHLASCCWEWIVKLCASKHMITLQVQLGFGAHASQQDYGKQD